MIKVQTLGPFDQNIFSIFMPAMPVRYITSSNLYYTLPGFSNLAKGMIAPEMYALEIRMLYYIHHTLMVWGGEKKKKSLDIVIFHLG